MKTLNKTQQGFTLVELIIVIVILGILAVTAAPKFLNLAGDAKGGTLQAVAGSVTTANSLINAKVKIQGLADGAKLASSFVYEGSDKIHVAYGYPVTSLVTAITTGTTYSGIIAGGVATMWGKLLDLNSADFLIKERRVNTSTDILELENATTTGVEAIVIYPADVDLPSGVTVTTEANACYVYVTEATALVDNISTAKIDESKPYVKAVTSGCSQ